MSDPRGALKVTAQGRDYTLWMGMSVLADLQAKHGSDVLSRLEPPADAPQDWLPDFSVVVDLFMLALERHHKDEADKYTVDEIFAENPNALEQLISSAFPDPKANLQGKAKGPKRAA